MVVMVGSFVCEHAPSVGQLLPLNLLAFIE